jgi:hypothetical protein
MRTVYIEVKVKIIANMDEGLEVGDFVQELDYIFKDNTGRADVMDTEILDYEVTDSK